MAGIRQFEIFCINNHKTEALQALDDFLATRRPNRPKRQKSVSRPITPEVRNEVLELWKTSELTQAEIGMFLGINQGRVNEIVNGTR